MHRPTDYTSSSRMGTGIDAAAIVEESALAPKEELGSRCLRLDVPICLPSMVSLYTEPSKKQLTLLTVGSHRHQPLLASLSSSLLSLSSTSFLRSDISSSARRCSSRTAAKPWSSSVCHGSRTKTLKPRAVAARAELK